MPWSGMEWDPVAARLLLYDQLATVERGTKIRFLACVKSYNIATGKLNVINTFLADAQSRHQVVIDVQAILESLSSELVEIGAVINVVGYVQQSRKVKDHSSTNDNTTAPTSKRIDVNAIMIWSAGALKMEEYNAAVLARQQVTPLE